MTRPEERQKPSPGLSLSAIQFVLRSLRGFRRNAPKGQNVSRSVAAKAVAAVEATRWFTGCVECLIKSLWFPAHLEV